MKTARIFFASALFVAVITGFGFLVTYLNALVGDPWGMVISLFALTFLALTGAVWLEKELSAS